MLLLNPLRTEVYSVDGIEMESCLAVILGGETAQLLFRYARTELFESVELHSGRDRFLQFGRMFSHDTGDRLYGFFEVFWGRNIHRKIMRVETHSCS